MNADFGPQLTCDSGTLRQQLLADADAFAVLVGSDRVAVAEHVSTMLGVDIMAAVGAEKVTGTAGELTPLTLPRGPQVLLAGVGEADSTGLRRAGAAIARAAQGRQHLVLDLAGYGDAGPLVEGLILASYRPPRIGIEQGPPAPVAAVTLVGVAAADIWAAQVAARATCVSRSLAATPSNQKTPAWMADQAVALARASSARRKLTVTTYDQRWIDRTGLRALSAVGAGSASSPRLVVVDYHPAGTSEQPVLLVGKGITFDTGGISIKPRDAMITMKTDMSGAAIVLAATLAAAELAVPQRVVALLPLAENAVSGSAYRPGDVITCYDGTTVEIGNTDAEGRMVLADAMAWGIEAFDPSVVVDVATLTGAASVGLGRQHGALYATSAQLTQELVAAGQVAGEPLWPMPLVPEYRRALRSTVADLSHIATENVGGGSITAALFLQHFAKDVPWAHLDIAGPGRASKDLHEITAGPTGFSARALVQWLSQADAGTG
ncbi:MAG: leucyl aminopeptidase family protein [Beutenbergiaceae bacterium]